MKPHQQHIHRDLQLGGEGLKDSEDFLTELSEIHSADGDDSSLFPSLVQSVSTSSLEAEFYQQVVTNSIQRKVKPHLNQIR